MKKLNTLAILAVLGAALGTTALAQNDGPPGGPGGGQFRGRPPMMNAGQLATNYAAVAVYDANKDGALDATEQAAVAQAIVDGKLQPPGPPRGGQSETRPAPTAEMAQRMAAEMTTLYAALAAYDVNKDGQLDDTEQAAVTKALADGTLTLPMRRGGGGGMRGGPRGGPEGGQPPPGQ